MLSSGSNRFCQFSLQPRTICSILLFVGGLLPIAGCKHASDPNIVATVNGRAILRSDVDRRYNAQLEGSPEQPRPSQEEADSLRLTILQALINQQILEQHAGKMNLIATNEEVDAKLTELKEPFTEEQFSDRLKANHTTLAELRDNLRWSITDTKFWNKEVNSKIMVTDSDIANYYNQHKADFNFIETKFHLAQIQVTSSPSGQSGNLQGSKATNDSEARKKVQALKNRLDSGEDFSTLAMNFSEQPEVASSGGDLGFISESQLASDPTLYAAIAKLKPGQITDILPIVDPVSKTQIGYSIYKLIAREPPGQRDLNDPRVQQAIRELLKNSRSYLLKTAYVEVLRDDAKVANFLAEKIKNGIH